MKKIKFKAGYKYQLAEQYSATISIKPETDLFSPSGFLSLSKEGLLVIEKGYAWDGPSGPTFDTQDFMRGSLVHDALYQLMREKLLSNILMRDDADRLLQAMCIEDGMGELRAWWVYKGLKIGGNAAAMPSNIKPVFKAP